MEKVRGSCLCGSVRYEAEGPLGPVGHCHCMTCRKAHSAAFATVARVSRAGFTWTDGERLLSAYESSPGKDRFFCSGCGSQLVAAWRDEDELILRVGCIDTEEMVEPAAHVWTDDKAGWYDLDAQLPVIPRGRQRRS